MCAFVQLRVRGASAWVCGVRLSGCGVRLHEHLVRFVIHSPQYVQERLCLLSPTHQTCPLCYTLWSSLCGTKQKKLFFLYSEEVVLSVLRVI